VWVLEKETVMEGPNGGLSDPAQGIHTMEHAPRRWKTHSRHRKAKEWCTGLKNGLN
jgi:hypothetical protein